MSRLDAIAAELGMTRDRARRYTKAIRDQFDSAPSYAQILRAVRDHRGGTPSPQQVVAALKKWQGGTMGAAGKGRRERPLEKGAPPKGRPRRPPGTSRPKGLKGRPSARRRDD